MSEDKGWRTSLALAGIPAVVLTLGGMFLPETPNSLMERGHYDKARQILVKVRGTENVDNEYEDIRIAAELANSVRSPVSASAAHRRDCALHVLRMYACRLVTMHRPHDQWKHPNVQHSNH